MERLELRLPEIEMRWDIMPLQHGEFRVGFPKMVTAADCRDVLEYLALIVRQVERREKREQAIEAEYDPIEKGC